MTKWILTGVLTMMTLHGAEKINFLGQDFELKSYNQKASPMWEFTTSGETVENWTKLITMVERLEAKTLPDLDRLSQGILDHYKANGGVVLMAKTMQSAKGPFNYILAAFPQVAQKRYELNFVKLELAGKGGLVTIYGVRIRDEKDAVAKAQAFLKENSQQIGMALEKVKLPDPTSLPRR